MARREQGLTVVELMIAMMVMLIITVPLVASFVIGIRTTTESQQDVTNSADAQVVAAFFDVDVSSALTASTSAGPSTCGGGAGRDVVLALAWKEGAADQRVSYVAVPNATTAARLGVSTAFELERVACGADTGTSLIGRQLVDAPTVVCDGDAVCDGTPRVITMSVREHSRLLSDDSTPTQFSFSVSGTRRVTP